MTSGSNLTVLGIVNAYQYWSEVLVPNWIDFSKNSSARNAINLAASAWHIVEWIHIDSARGFSAQVLKDVQNHFIQECPALEVMHDVVTLGKHFKMSKPKAGIVQSRENMTAAVFHFGPQGIFTEHPAEFTIVLSDGKEVDLHETFVQVVRYWEGYFAKPVTGKA